MALFVKPLEMGTGYFSRGNKKVACPLFVKSIAFNRLLRYKIFLEYYTLISNVIKAFSRTTEERWNDDIG
jgi:hypothetical protein